MFAPLRGPWPRHWQMSLRAYVTGALLIALLPLLVHTVLATWYSYSSTRLWAERDLLGDAEHLARDVDGRLDASRSVMHVVAMSPAARRGDLGAVREHLALARDDGLISAARVLGANGEVLLAVGIDPGLPAGGPASTEQFLASTLDGQPVLVATWPIRSTDTRLRILQFMTPVALLKTAGGGVETWPWHMAAVADRDGAIVWSSEDLGDGLRRHLQDPSIDGGILHGWVAPDGHKQSVAFARAERSGLTVVVGQPPPSLYQRVPLGPVAAGAIAVGMAALSVVLARLGALQINAAYQSAMAGAQAGRLRISDAMQLGAETRRRRDRLFQATGGIAVVELLAAPGQRLEEGEIAASANVRELVGMAPDAPLTSASFLGALPMDCLSAMHATLAEADGRAVSCSHQIRIERTGRGPRYLNLIGMLREGPADGGRDIVLTLQDVTAQRETELELVAQASRLRLAVGIAGLGIWERDVVHGTGHASGRVWEIMGLEPHASIDLQTFFQAVHPDDRERVREAMATKTERETAAGPALAEQPEALRYRILRPDGTVRHVRSSRVFVEDGMGHVQRVVGVLIDETEAVVAQRTLAASEARFRLAVEVAELGVFERTIDAHRNVGIWNERMWRIRGLEPRPEPMAYDELVEMVHPDDRERVGGSMRQRRERENGSTEYEFRIIRPDGEERIIHSRSMRTYNAEEDGSVSIIAINQDVTERRRAEMALAASEARFRLAVEIARLGVAELEPRTGRGTWNERLFRIFGLAPRAERPSQAELLALIHPDDRAGLQALMARQLQAEEGHVVEYECRIVRPDGQERILLLRNEMLRRPDGALIQSSIAQDVTERRRAERAMEEAAAQFRLAVETAELGFAQLDTATGKGMWSDRLFRIYGLEPRAERPSMQEMLSLVHPDDRERVAGAIAAQRAGGDEQPVETEFRIVRPDRQERIVLVRSVKLRRADGSETLSTVTQDVTEQRRAVEALAESELRLRLAVDAAGLGIWDYDRQADRLMWSERMWQARGQPPGAQAPTRDEMLAMVVPEDRGKLLQFWEQMGGPEDEVEYEYRVRLADGTVRHLSGLGRKMRDAAGVVVRVVGVSSDITEQRTAQRALAESEARLRLAVETAGLGVAELRMATGRGVWNDQLYRICGLEPGGERPPLAGVMAMVHADDRAPAAEALAAQRAGNQGQVMEIDFRLVRPDGAERIVHVRSTVLHPASGEETLLTVFQDITERRRAERAMAQSEARFRLAVETAEMGVAERDMATGQGMWNEQMLRIAGLAPGERQLGNDDTMAMVHPDDRALIADIRTRHAADADGYVSDYDYRMVRPDGEARILHARTVTLRDADGGVTMLSVNQDVTERRRAERAVAESELRLRLATEATGVGIWDYDPATNQLVWSDRMWRLRGMEPRPEPLAVEAQQTGVVPEDRQVLENVLEWLATGEPQFNYDYRVLLPDGSVRHLRGEGRTLRDAEGRPVRTVGMVMDVTAQRTAELVLRDKTTTLELALEASGQGVWVRDPDKDERDASARVWEMFGQPGRVGPMTSAELYAGIHPDDREAVRRDWVPATGEAMPRQRQFRTLWPDGTVRHIQSHRAVLRDHLGKVVRVIGVIADITERREAEIELKDRTTTLELAIQAADLGLWLRAPHRIERDASPRVWEMFGHPDRTGLMSRDELMAAVHPDDRVKLDNDWEPVGQDPDARRVEFRLVWPDGQVRHVRSSRTVLRDADGDVRRVIGVMADITDARRSRAALAASEERLRLAVEAAEMGVFDYDPVTREGVWSDRTWRLRGLEPRPGIPSLAEVAATLHPEDRPRGSASAQRQFDAPDGTRIDNEFRVVWPDGTVRYLMLRSVVHRGADGKARVFGINMDVTERRTAALALAASEARLRLAVETAGLGVFDVDPVTRAGQWSDRMWLMRGLVPRPGKPTPEEAIALVHPEDRELTLAHTRKQAALAEGELSESEVRVVWPDGSIHFIQSRSITQRGVDGEVQRIFGINLDVTESRRAAQALAESEARLRLAVETAELGVFHVRMPGRIGQWSDRMWRMRGLEPQSHLPTSEEALAFVHPDDRERMRQFVTPSSPSEVGAVERMQFRLLRPDGEVRHIAATTIVTRGTTDDSWTFIGVNQDITEQVEREQALVESEARFRLASEIADLGVFQIRMPGRVGQWSDRMWRMRGLEPQSNLPTTQEALACVHPDDRERMSRYRTSDAPGKPGEVVQLQYRLLLPDGSVRHIAARTIVMRSQNNISWTYTGVNQDITEQVERERALQEAAARYELAVEAAELGVFEFDPESRTGYWSDRIWQMRGLTPRPGTLSFDEVIALVHPDEREAVRARMRKHFIEPDGTRGEYEFRIVRPDGEVRHIMSRAVTQRHPDGGLHRIFGINLDITDRRRAAQALEESEARLRMASEAAELGVFQVNAPGGDGYWSERMWLMRDMEPRPAVPSTDEALAAVHPMDRELVFNSWQAALRRPHGDVARLAFRVVRRDGAVRHIMSCNIILHGREGARSFIGVNLDVTDQMEHERMLREAAARFELAIDAAQLAVWEWNPDTGTMIWSQRMWEIVGLPRSDSAPPVENRIQAVHPDDRDKVPSFWFQEALQTGASRGEGEYRRVRPDGALRYLHWQGIPLRDVEGRVVRLAGVVADVTEMRLAEQALRNSEELFRMAAEAAEQGVWNHDLASEAMTWSPLMWRIHGLAPAEGAPPRAARISLIHSEDREEVLGLLQELEVAGPNTVKYQSYRITRADGAVRMLEGQAMLVRDPVGRPARVVGVVHDVTEARELTAQTLVADKLATLGEMAGAIAHELAQPLQAVMATAATARMRLANGATDEAVERVSDRLAWIERQTARAGKTIQHLLSFSRGESSEGLSLLANALEGAMELAGHGLRQAAIEVHKDLPDTLPPVRGGQIEIEQVLVNLLNNARDAIGDRELRKIRIVARQEGDSVLLDVTDTGGGVPADRLERIFEPFFTTKPVGRGTGIGLSVARRTMKAIGGAIAVANTDVGACFTLTFTAVTATE